MPPSVYMDDYLLSCVESHKHLAFHIVYICKLLLILDVIIISCYLVYLKLYIVVN